MCFNFIMDLEQINLDNYDDEYKIQLKHIERDLTDIKEISEYMNKIVTIQDNNINKIENNLISIENNVDRGVSELKNASLYHNNIIWKVGMIITLPVTFMIAPKISIICATGICLGIRIFG